MFTKTVIVVYAFIQKKDGSFLVIKRADNDSHPGTWEMPGGSLNFGEDLQDGIKREVKEETGLDVKVIKPVAYESAVMGSVLRKHKIRISFLAETLTEGQSVYLSKEHQDYKWIKNLEDKNTSPFLIKALNSI